jgi:hypothetical protein
MSKTILDFYRHDPFNPLDSNSFTIRRQSCISKSKKIFSW